MAQSKPHLQTLIYPLIDLVEKVGQRISELYKKEIKSVEKKDGSPVTQADEESHQLLTEGLETLTPSIPVVSEEDPSSWPIKKSFYWLIDPLDGTRGYIHKNGEFCINIALMENDKPIFGLIHLPLTQETFYGYEGQAFRYFQGTSHPIQTRPCPPEGMTLLLGGYGKKFKAEEDFFLKAYPIIDIKRIQSAIKFCVIAAGQADLYLRFEECCEWDTAAGQALVEAAGGSVTNIDGTPFIYGKPGLLNKAFVVFGRKP